MRSQELTLGRTFAVAFDHGEDFYATLDDFCRTNRIRQGFVPLFIAGFAEVDVVGTCAKLEDPQAPVWSAVHLTNVEAVGGGTIAYDEAEDKILPHIHVSVGLKHHSATAHTSHLLSFLKERGRVNPLGWMFVTGFPMFPGSVRTYAGKGSGSRLDRRSTRGAGLVLTPIPFGAESWRRERDIGGCGVAVFFIVDHGRSAGRGARLPVIPSPRPRIGGGMKDRRVAATSRAHDTSSGDVPIWCQVA